MSDTRPLFNGIGYVPGYARGIVPVRRAAELIERMGAACVRLWHPFAELMETPDVLRPDVADFYHEVIRTLQERGLRVISMNHDWFRRDPEGAPKFLGFAAPHRDAAEYNDFLELYERAWATQAREFTEVDGWETGNEMNHVPFLHAADADVRGEFTLLERADIATDLMRRSARAIRAAQPEAIIVMPGMAPIGGNRVGVFAENVAVEYDGILNTLDRIYENIESGAFGSTNPRDFFDKLCWHPYYARQDEQGEWSFVCPDEEWAEINDGVYQVAVHHGDGGVGCYLSEYGFNDWGREEDEARLGRFLVSGLRLAKERMPYVECVQVYRLLNLMNTPDVIDDYSLFDCRSGGIRPKQKAFAVQEFFGGRGALTE